MTKQTKEYRAGEFAKVGTEYSEYRPKLKIIKPDGATNWIDITEAELKAIEKILTGKN